MKYAHPDWARIPTSPSPTYCVVSLFCSECHRSYSLLGFMKIHLAYAQSSLLMALSFILHKFKLHKQHRILISTFLTQATLLCLLPTFRCHSQEYDHRQGVREVELILHVSLLSRIVVLHCLLPNTWKYLKIVAFYIFVSFSTVYDEGLIQYQLFCHGLIMLKIFLFKWIK